MLDSNLATLKPKQRLAVEHSEGPLLVLAGAGTGKTTTITTKIAYMIEYLGIPPEEILALTFSRDAAKNMQQKVQDLLGRGRDVNVSTFHSFCSELLREHPDECGVSENFTIYEDMDLAIYLHRELDIDSKKAAHYSSSISKAKDLNLSIGDFKGYIDGEKEILYKFGSEDGWEQLYHDYKVNLNTFHLKDKSEQKALKEEKKSWQEFIHVYDEYRKYQDFINAWKSYEEKKSNINALDYGDLNYIALQYLDTYGTEELNDTYRYIVVDEFQDTNYLQFELIKRLTASEQNVTIVADPNQSIYAFRGAYTDNIEEFKKKYDIHEDDFVAIDVSYRSTNKILRVSHELIQNNYSDDRKSECILLKNHEDSEGDNVIIQETVDDKEEARKIAEMVDWCAEEGTPLEDVAVLYRTHSQGRVVKDTLQRRGFPVSVKENTDFLKLPEIKTALAYLYVLNNFTHPTPRGTESWWRLFHYNKSLDRSDSIKIAEYIKNNRTTLQDVIYHHLDKLALSDRGLEIINSVKQSIDTLFEKTIYDISDLLLEIYDYTGLVRQFSGSDTVRNREALLNLRKLYETAETFEQMHGRDLSDFIAYLEILDEMDGNPSAANITDDNAVNLMTIHSAKGLEFDTVFVINMADNRFPLKRGGKEPLIPYELMEQYRDIFESDFDSEKELNKAIDARKKQFKTEEERRLCYVAFTRAKSHLVLTFSDVYNGSDSGPSDFLYDIGFDDSFEDGDALDDITFYRDTENRAKELVKDDDIEREKQRRRKLLMESMDSDDVTEPLKHLLVYQELVNKEDRDYLVEIKSNWSKINPLPEASRVLDSCESGKCGPKFDPDNLSFSYSSIKTYEECPKKYELQELLRMPDRSSEKFGEAANIGSFVHKALEIAVKRKVETKNQLYEIVYELAGKPDWKMIDLKQTYTLFDTFWERHKDKIQNNFAVEKRFSVPIGGFYFKGFIDRVDLLSNHDKEVEVIDYKTGKTEPPTGDRSRQLLLYSYGFNHLYPEYTVRRVTLDMLGKEKPKSFEING
ncbi:MAG: ATP-dependent helicase, partial [Methanohalobium sp.]|uniref:ATP-dependent helicase n=1 Tax=Methanohalobium sp. TaxID=2837493 RepID=UPI00397AF228